MTETLQYQQYAYLIKLISQNEHNLSLLLSFGEGRGSAWGAMESWEEWADLEDGEVAQRLVRHPAAGSPSSSEDDYPCFLWGDRR